MNVIHLAFCMHVNSAFIPSQVYAYVTMQKQEPYITNLAVNTAYVSQWPYIISIYGRSSSHNSPNWSDRHWPHNIMERNEAQYLVRGSQVALNRHNCSQIRNISGVVCNFFENNDGFSMIHSLAACHYHNETSHVRYIDNTGVVLSA